MSTTEKLEAYKEQIHSIAFFAKRTGFNPETGNFDTLFRDWINDGLAFQKLIADNKDEFLRIIKHFI